jgi:hypothetical protein
MHSAHYDHMLMLWLDGMMMMMMMMMMHYDHNPIMAS